MHLLVCIKQVPAYFGQLVPDTRHEWIAPVPGAEWKMNRFDTIAVEAAIQLKETHPSITIDVISMGPQRVQEVLRRALGMGADRAIHVEGPEHGYLPPSDVAGALHAATCATDYDLILTGILSEDLMQAQTGPMLAALRGIPCVAGATALDLTDTGSVIRILKEMEAGIRQPILTKLPVLVTLQAGGYQPRYPNVRNLVAANRVDIPLIKADLPPAGAHLRETAAGTRLPDASRKCKFIDGSLEEKTDAVIALARQRNLIA